MKAKLKVIKNWEFEEFELTGTSFKYSPTGCKGMVARSEDEIVFWTYHLVQKCSGVLLLSGKLNDAPSGRLFRADFRTLQMCQSL